MQDEVFYRLSGVMEYDRTLHEQGNYRQFLFHTARYREVVPLDTAFDPASQVYIIAFAYFCCNIYMMFYCCLCYISVRLRVVLFAVTPSHKYTIHE